MKKLISLVFVFLSFVSYSQKLDSYKASNGIVYHVNDTIKLGRGSAPNGDFLYLQMGGWGAAMSYNSNRGSNQFNIGRSYSGLNVIVRKIRSFKFKGAESVVFVVAGGNITNYNLMIEDAIKTCEIADCKKDAIPVTVVNQTSKFDELKKLKELFDSGALTEEEYKAEKEKLLK